MTGWCSPCSCQVLGVGGQVGAGPGNPTWGQHQWCTIQGLGLPIGASVQAVKGENCASPQYNGKAQEAPKFSKRCLWRQTSQGIANPRGAKSRGQNLPSAAWGATGACVYSQYAPAWQCKLKQNPRYQCRREAHAFAQARSRVATCRRPAAAP